MGRYSRHAQDTRWLFQENRCDEALRSLESARTVDANRFERDRFSKITKGCSRPEKDAIPTTLRRALVLLVEGKAIAVIGLLENLAGQAGDWEIHVQAYLGSAYAQSSLLEVQPAEERAGKARVHFTQVVQLQPDYQLSERLHSPKVRQLLEDVRSTFREQMAP